MFLPMYESKRVYYALLTIYFKQIPILKSINLIAVLLCIYVLKDASAMSLFLWYMAHMFNSLFEIYLAYTFQKDQRYFHANTWLLLLIPPTIISASLWVYSLSLLLEPIQADMLIIVLVMLLAILSGALYTLSLLRPLYYLFVTFLIGQICIFLLWHAPMDVIIWGGVILAIFLIWLSSQIHHIMYQLLWTEQKNKAYFHKLNRAKRMAERSNAIKNRFIKAVSHDLRQPMQAMALYMELLKHRLQQHSALETVISMQASYTSLSHLMNSLFDLSKLDGKKIQAQCQGVYLQALIHRLFENHLVVAQEKGLQLSCKGGDIWVYSDAHLLERILGNLLSNAIRYTKQGRILLTVRQYKQAIIIDVWDTGIGIPHGQLTSIFKEFYQLDDYEYQQDKGLGLGLSIIKQFIKILPHHRIEVCSKEKKGTRFRLSLPLAPPETIASKHLQHLESKSYQVLLIEDHKETLQAMLHLISSWGYAVKTAHNYQAAINLVQTSWIPDAIVTDYHLAEKKQA